MDMDNNDVKKFVEEAKTRWLSEVMWQFIMDNYSDVPIKSGLNGLADEYKRLPWTKVCLFGGDWKYGSFWIYPDKMLRRGDTIEEFYGLKH